MIWLLSIVAYVAGVLVSLRPAYRIALEAAAQEHQADRERMSQNFSTEQARQNFLGRQPPLIGHGDRADARITMWFCSLFWPAAWPFRWAWLLLDRLTHAVTRGVTTSAEQAEQDRAELERLRAAARTYGLDTPGVPDHLSNGEQYRHESPCPLRMETGWGGGIHADPHAAGHDWYTCPHQTHLGVIGG